MTPEQQNIAIAKACGAEWVVSRSRLGFPEALLVFRDRYTPAESWDIPSSIEDAKLFRERSVHRSVPRYCNNLNAMHEAEKTLDEINKANYSRLLREMVWTSEQPSFSQINATAAQKAEAFLRNLNLWQDDN